MLKKDANRFCGKTIYVCFKLGRFTAKSIDQFIDIIGNKRLNCPQKRRKLKSGGCCISSFLCALCVLCENLFLSPIKSNKNRW